LQFLHLPSEIVPDTHKKPVRAQPPARQAGGGRDGAYRAPRGGDRDGYRRREDGDAKEGSGEFKPVSLVGVARLLGLSLKLITSSLGHQFR